MAISHVKDVAASLVPTVRQRQPTTAKTLRRHNVRRCGVTRHCCCGSLEADCCGSGKFRLLTSKPISGPDGNLRNPCILTESAFQACSQQREARHWTTVQLPFSSFPLCNTGVLVPTFGKQRDHFVIPVSFHVVQVRCAHSPERSVLIDVKKSSPRFQSFGTSTFLMSSSEVTGMVFSASVSFSGKTFPHGHAESMSQCSPVRCTGSLYVGSCRRFTGLLKSHLNACHMWSFAFLLEVSPLCSVTSSNLHVSLRGFSYPKYIATLSLKFEIAPGLRLEVEGDGHDGLRLSAPWFFSSRPAGTLYKFAVQVFSLRRLLWLHVLL